MTNALSDRNRVPCIFALCHHHGGLAQREKPVFYFLVFFFLELSCISCTLILIIMINLAPAIENTKSVVQSFTVDQSCA